MTRCAVLECKNNSGNKNLSRSGISFHRFPKDPDVKEKWITATGRINWMPPKSSCICSEHFAENDILITIKGLRYINPNAFPTKKIMSYHYQNEKMTSPSSKRVNILEEPGPSSEPPTKKPCISMDQSQKDLVNIINIKPADNITTKSTEASSNTTRRQTYQPSSSKCEAVGMDVDENNSWRPQESDSTKNNQNRFLTVQPISFRCRLCAEDQPYDNLQPKTFNDSSSRICFAVKLKHLGSTFHEFFGDFDNKLLPEFVCDPCNGALEASFKLFLQMENAKLFFSKLSGECEREKNEDPLVSGSYSEIMIKEEPIIDNDSKINIKVEIENDTAINEYDSKISIENHEIKSETSEITIKTEPVDFNDLQIKEEYDSVLNENDTVINEYDNDISIEDHDIKSEASNDSMIEPQEKVERASSSTTKPKPTQTKSKNPKKRAILPANAPAQAHPTTNKRIRKPKIKEHTEETQQEDTSTYQYLHLDLVKLGTTADQIRKHMETVCGRDICSVESLKTPGQYASFKLGIPAKFTDLFLAPATWPGDISIEPWKENY